MEGYAYRNSYIEKDYFVRNNTSTSRTPPPGSGSGAGAAHTTPTHNQSRTLNRHRARSRASASSKARLPPQSPPPSAHLLESFALPQHEFEKLSLLAANEADKVQKARQAAEQERHSSSKSKRRSRTSREFRYHPSANTMNQIPTFDNPVEAEQFAQNCLHQSAFVQRVRVPGGGGVTVGPSRGGGGGDGGSGGGASAYAAPPAAVGPDYEAAGKLYQTACDVRARTAPLYLTAANAETHTEYARNLNRRGLIPEAEYHLRTAADIWRLLGATSSRRYADVLLYTALVIDRQSTNMARRREAEFFYKAALAVYRNNKFADLNVDIAIDQLGENLKAQGRPNEIFDFVKHHFKRPHAPAPAPAPSS